MGHGLSEQWHMMDWAAQKNTVDLCAYGWPYKKATDLWLKGFELTPVGRTGTGRCRQLCGQGEVNPATGKYAHFQALGVEPQRGPRGTSHVSGKCGMPRELLKEILKAACGGEDITNKVVLDLCAGFQSMKEVAEDMGARYLAVDLEGARNKASSSIVKQAGIVLMSRHASSVANAVWSSVVSKADGSIAVEQVLPGEQPRAAAERALLKHYDITVDWIRERVRENVRVYERDGITLYVYNLVAPPLPIGPPVVGGREVWKDRCPALTQQALIKGARWGPPVRLRGAAADVLKRELGF